MAKSWATFEGRVRAVASHIWGGDCEPENIGGVDVDGVIHASNDIQIFIEITVERDLHKVRTDVNKLRTARAAYLAAHHSFARCYCVLNGEVTKAMKGAGKADNINVLSFEDFAAIFFNFGRYRSSRDAAAFGSAINPLTGTIDTRDYVPVTYLVDGSSREMHITEIVKQLKEGNRVVLLGEYGSGKSRCIREVFRSLADTAAAAFLYPLALNLRDCWGLRRGPELIQRHVAELGLESQVEAAAVRALNAHRIILLLDGFDELGSQSWSNDSDKLRVIRSKSLEGVRELVKRSSAGVLITGREHYFNSNDEMFTALGLDANSTLVLRCKAEFSIKEMEEFFEELGTEIVLPDWLPRRPLICQTIADMPEDDIDQMFGVGQDELGFWDHFIKVICEREARIHTSFDSKTIERVLTHLSRLTRSRPADVGPITLADVQSAFEAVVGQLPVEEASLMLQRLPALGRVAAESNDRQFIDTYILDGLRAKDVSRLLSEPEATVALVLQTQFRNPLGQLGQRILARDIEDRLQKASGLAHQCAAAANKVLCSDLVAALLQAEVPRIDFGNLTVNEGEFSRLDFSKTVAKDLSIQDSIIGVLVLPLSPPINTTIQDTLVDRVIGVTAASGLPIWIQRVKAEKYDSAESVSRIRKIGLSPAHEILVTIVRKTFFQKGSGRKEEALTRGLGQMASRQTVAAILSLLIREHILTTFQGKEGDVYKPNRNYAGRMKAMLYELKTSQDPIWTQVGAMRI